MKYIRTYESTADPKVESSGDDLIVDLAQFLKMMSKYGLESVDGIRLTSTVNREINPWSGQYENVVEMLIYLTTDQGVGKGGRGRGRRGDNRLYTIWVRSGSVMVYYPGELHTVAVIAHEYQMISNQDDLDQCMSILRSATLQLRKTRGQMGQKGDIEYVDINLEEEFTMRKAQEQERLGRLKELNPETQKWLMDMFREAGFNVKEGDHLLNILSHERDEDSE